MEIACYQMHNVTIEDCDITVSDLEAKLAIIYGIEPEQINLYFRNTKITREHKLSYFQSPLVCTISKQFLLNIDGKTLRAICTQTGKLSSSDFVKLFGRELQRYQILKCNNKIVDSSVFNIEFESGQCFSVVNNPSFVAVSVRVETFDEIINVSGYAQLQSSFAETKYSLIPSIYWDYKFRIFYGDSVVDEACALQDFYEPGRQIIYVIEAKPNHVYAKISGKRVRAYCLDDICHYRAVYKGEDVTGKFFKDFHGGENYIVFDECDAPYQIFACFDIPKFSKRTYTIEVHEMDTIEMIAALLEKKSGVPASQIRLIYAGKQLECGRTLRDYCIFNWCTLHMVLRLRGGGVDFANAADGSSYQNFRWNADAPKWRIAKKGLCIEGVCKNSYCEAYGNNVVVNLGYTYAEISDLYKCPLCACDVKGSTCAFNNCFYKIVGQRDGQKIDTSWRFIGDNYKRCNEHLAGTVTWDKLILIASETDPENLCAICLETMARESVQNMAKCDHVFHKACIDMWMLKSKCCPLCRI